MSEDDSVIKSIFEELGWLLVVPGVIVISVALMLHSS